MSSRPRIGNKNKGDVNLSKRKEPQINYRDEFRLINPKISFTNKTYQDDAKARLEKKLKSHGHNITSSNIKREINFAIHGSYSLNLKKYWKTKIPCNHIKDHVINFLNNCRSECYGILEKHT